MARKKEKKRKARGMGFGAEEREEALEAEGLKRTQMDVGRVELVDRDTSTPYIETYDEDTGELEGTILLKDGNREGLLAVVRIVEEVDVKQDHDANIESLGFSGKLNVENPSDRDRLWDIDITLKNIESTSLKSDKIEIKELGVTDDDNIESEEFEISGEAKSLLLVKEYINTLPDADNVLNINDIETDILKLKDQTAKAEKLPEKEEEEDEDEETDAGAEEYSLESFGISIDTENTVTFAIAMISLFESPIRNITVTKTIPADFSKTRVTDTTIGNAELEGDQLIWTIDVLDPETTVLCKFTSEIMVSDIEARKTGEIEVTYEAASSFAEGLGIDKFDAYTTNRFYVDIMERDEEPGVWDCKLVFENSSEFIVQLFNADVYAPDAKGTKFVDIDPEDVPTLPAGAEWHSVKWEYESDDYPQIRKLLEFRVMPDFVTQVNGTIAISDVELAIASLTGEVLYTISETAEPTSKEIEEMLIQIPTFKETDVIAVHKLENNGSAPLNEIVVQQQFFSDEYQAPNADEITILWDGSEIEVDASAVSVDGNVFKIELTDLKDSSTGMFEPESNLEVQYPIHCVNPAQESRFETEVIYLANTYPLSNEIEVRPDVPAIEAIHIRRKFRVGKEVLAVGDLGNYKIILILENIGDQALTNLILMDKVPDNFEYSEFTMQPEITDEVGADTLKWEIEELAEAEKLEISYEISGKGEYKPSEAQLAL